MSLSAGYAHSAPINDAQEVTPHDTAEYDGFRGFMVDGEGDLRIETFDGTQVTLIGMLPGVIYPIRARKFMATGTTNITKVIGLI